MIDRPEQHTWASMAHGLGIRPPMDQPDQLAQQTVKRGELWPAGDPIAWTKGAILGYVDAARRGGSENFPLTALACMILLGTPAERLWAIGQATACLQEQKDVRGWMGTEIGSRVYWEMHLIAVLIFSREGDTALRNLAREWLAIFWTWMSLAEGKAAGCVLWLGQRSCEPGRQLPNNLDDLAMGQWPPRLWSLGAAMLSALDARGSRSNAPFPAWKTAVPVHIYRSDAGEVTVIVERSVNNNTPAILGASTVGGKLQWAPEPPYVHIRQQADTAEMRIGPAAALYRNSKWYKDVALPLPAKPRFHWVVGGPVVREDEEVIAVFPPPMPKPSHPAKSGCLTLLLAVLAGLACWATIALAWCL